MKIIKKNVSLLVLLTFIVFTPPILSFAGTAECGRTVNEDATSCLCEGAQRQTGVCCHGIYKDIKSVADCPGASAVTVDNPITPTSLNDFIKSILIGVIKIGIPVVALAIVYCGFLFVSARGNPEDLKKARNALIYTLIGAAILLGAWAIAQLISNTVLSL